ncbi:hypothetical protein [Sediminitomix flava]|uniref:Uncharacterized protein n=1 Tax=Sediminitomix flava TaxID=379075 RepID=A0A315ZDK6_SEDFL|nr:hypothetical protein [Sediminitomix flava]PWJ42804.1 hypothetical protein BC781_102350 [Sediminitomix flava]
METDQFQDALSNLDSQQIEQLTGKLDQLSPDDVLELQAELYSRNLKQLYPVLRKYVEKKGSNYFGITSVDIKEMVEQRLAIGENLESIKLDFKERGFDIFEIMNQQIEKETEVLDKYDDLVSQGFSKEEISAQLGTKNQNHDQLEQKSKERSSWKRTLGIALFIIAILRLIIRIFDLN